MRCSQSLQNRIEISNPRLCGLVRSCCGSSSHTGPITSYIFFIQYCCTVSDGSITSSTFFLSANYCRNRKKKHILTFNIYQRNTFIRVPYSLFSYYLFCFQLISTFSFTPFPFIFTNHNLQILLYFSYCHLLCCFPITLSDDNCR